MAEQLISTADHDTLPGSYVRPETERPRLREVVSDDAEIPVVDLADPDRAAVVARVAEACRTHGFFQVLNHGVPEELMLAMLTVAYEFFGLPAEEKAKLYSDDPGKKMRLSTSFNVRKETVHNWRDYLRLHCHPLEKYAPDWPDNPPSFRETVSAYCREVRALGFRLYGAISEGLGLEPGYIKETLGEQEQHMAVNFYPRCPAPDLTYGLPAHTDPNALTILLMDHHVAGLQVLKDARWIEARRPRRQHRGPAAGAEQRQVQERVAPRGGERGQAEDVGGVVPVPLQRRAHRPRRQARHRGHAGRVQGLHLCRVLRQVLEQEPGPGALPRALQVLALAAAPAYAYCY